jgi:hypothetical protein
MTSQTSDAPSVTGSSLLGTASDSVALALRDLGIVAAHLASGGGRLDEFRVPISQVCAAAREAGLLPERLLIRVKQVIDQSGFPERADDDDRTTLRRQIISLAIVEYFSQAEPRAAALAHRRQHATEMAER